MKIYLINELCNFCSCKEEELHKFLLKPKFRNDILGAFYGSILQTFFTCEDKLKRVFYFQGFSVQTASSLKSSEYLPKTLLFNDIKSMLNYPDLPLVIDYISPNNIKLYPIELLEYVNADYIGIM